MRGVKQANMHEMARDQTMCRKHSVNGCIVTCRPSLMLLVPMGIALSMELGIRRKNILITSLHLNSHLSFAKFSFFLIVICHCAFL